MWQMISSIQSIKYVFVHLHHFIEPASLGYVTMKYCDSCYKNFSRLDDNFCFVVRSIRCQFGVIWQNSGV